MVSSFGYHSIAVSTFQDKNGSNTGLPTATARANASEISPVSLSSSRPKKFLPKPRSEGSGRDSPR